MILVADSGSTKTEWALAEDPDHIDFLSTAGYNPYFDEEITWLDPLSGWLRKRSAGFPKVDMIYYYGAGCDRREGSSRVEEALRSLFPDAGIIVEDDLSGAARALYGRERGISLILGTGTHAGVWDGGKIRKKIVPMGYLLGDHGSGASLGLRFVRAWLDRELPEEVTEDFLKTYDLSRQKIKEKIYLEGKPNYFLASFAPFIHKYLDVEAVSGIVRDEFRRLLRAELLPLAEEFRVSELRAAGSVAWYFRDYLAGISGEYGLTLKKTIRYPLRELVLSHLHFPDTGKNYNLGKK